MSSFSTYLSEPDVNLIVSESGKLIRDFYAFLLKQDDESRFAPYANTVPGLLADERIQFILDHFRKNPQDFEDEVLLNNGSDIGKSFQFPVRIEVRKRGASEEVSQVAVGGLWGPARQVAFDHFQNLEPFSSNRVLVKSSGRSSFEFNIMGVTKALPIRYLRNQWDEICTRIKYVSTKEWDAASSRTCIAADGDGTTYGAPSGQHLPKLGESPAYQSILEYLKLGGIFVIISGNRLERTVHRVEGDLPMGLRNQVLVSANGGADLGYFDEAGQFQLIDGYSQVALNSSDDGKELDIVYLGDDANPNGNDFEAFQSVGSARSICVADEDNPDPFFLRTNVIGGYAEGTDRFFKNVNKLLKDGHQGSLFSEEIVLKLGVDSGGR